MTIVESVMSQVMEELGVSDHAELNALPLHRVNMVKQKYGLVPVQLSDTDKQLILEEVLINARRK